MNKCLLACNKMSLDGYNIDAVIRPNLVVHGYVCWIQDKDYNDQYGKNHIGGMEWLVQW